MTKAVMTLILAQCVQFMLLLHGITGLPEPPNGNDALIFPLKIYNCDGSENILDINLELRNINDDGDKVLDLDFEIEEPFTEKWGLNVKLDKWNNGAWDENFFNSDDTTCEMLNKYLPKIWKKAKAQVSPVVTEECFIEPQHYSLKNFEVSRDDYNIPATVFGRFRLTSKLLDESQSEVWCFVMEAEVNRK